MPKTYRKKYRKNIGTEEISSKPKERFPALYESEVVNLLEYPSMKDGGFKLFALMRRYIYKKTSNSTWKHFAKMGYVVCIQSFTKLAEETGFTKSYVSRLIDAMIKDGLVKEKIRFGNRPYAVMGTYSDPSDKKFVYNKAFYFSERPYKGGVRTKRRRRC